MRKLIFILALFLASCCPSGPDRYERAMLVIDELGYDIGEYTVRTLYDKHRTFINASGYETYRKEFDVVQLIIEEHGSQPNPDTLFDTVVVHDTVYIFRDE